MIKTGKDLVEDYCKAFSAVGGNPESCAGVLWARSLLDKQPEITADQVIAGIGRKIVDGTADHGWLIGILNLLWAQLSQGQRLAIMSGLVAGGAHKWIVSKSLTTPEREYLRAVFERDCAIAALRRLDG